MLTKFLSTVGSFLVRDFDVLVSHSAITIPVGVVAFAVVLFVVVRQNIRDAR